MCSVVTPIYNILDIGCSIGIMTRRLAGKALKVIGIYNNPELLAYSINNNSNRKVAYELMDAN